MTTATAMQYETTEARLDGPKGPMLFRLFKTESCFQVAHNIFAGTTYPQVSFITDVKTVFDVGANVGAASVYFATLYPNATIYAFEPASAPFSLLKPNTASLPNILPFDFGFYAQERQGLLYHGKQDSVESSVCPTNRTDMDSETIQLMSASKFMAEKAIEKIDVLKLDTEGCEVHILRTLQQYLPEIKVFYVEYHSDRDRRLIDELMAETHVLWRGNVPLVHRGEFCYLNRKLIPSETYSSEILLPLD